MSIRSICARTGIVIGMGAEGAGSPRGSGSPRAFADRGRGVIGQSKCPAAPRSGGSCRDRAPARGRPLDRAGLQQQVVHGRQLLERRRPGRLITAPVAACPSRSRLQRPHRRLRCLRVLLEERSARRGGDGGAVTSASGSVEAPRNPRNPPAIRDRRGIASSRSSPVVVEDVEQLTDAVGVEADLGEDPVLGEGVEAAAVWKLDGPDEPVVLQLLVPVPGLRGEVDPLRGARETNVEHSPRAGRSPSASTSVRALSAAIRATGTPAPAAIPSISAAAAGNRSDAVERAKALLLDGPRRPARELERLDVTLDRCADPLGVRGAELPASRTGIGRGRPEGPDHPPAEPPPNHSPSARTPCSWIAPPPRPPNVPDLRPSSAASASRRRSS